LKVLFTSGYSQDFAADGFLEEGVNFLPKPYSPPALLQMVRFCLNKEHGDAIAPPVSAEDRFPACAA
jgi:hypothetical protein